MSADMTTDLVKRLEAGETAFFHGGPRGLREVLPSSITGVPSTASYGAEGICRRDRVYVTTDLSAAIMFAAGNPFGAQAVYQVEPEGLEPDPDCRVPGLSFGNYIFDSPIIPG